MRMTKALCLALALLLGVGSVAHADSEVKRRRAYLHELAFVLSGVRSMLSWTDRHRNDAQMAGFVHPLSVKYVEMASKLLPTTRLSSAHPHVIIVAENAERAVDAASHGEVATFRKRLRTVREELRTLEAVLKHLKVRLPEVR